MGDKTKFEGWTSIINSVKTPLGFFTLLVLIIDAVFFGGSAISERIPIWAPVVILSLLITYVFIIVLIKPHVLYHPRDWPTRRKTITVKLIFPIEPINIDLNVEKCTLEVRNEAGHKKLQVVPNFIWGHGGWTFRLPEDIVDTDSVCLELMGHNGRKWKVKPFTPYETNVEVLQINKIVDK